MKFNRTPGGDFVEQLIPYEHGDDISTIIPSDVITIGKTMYLHAVVNRGFGNVIWSGIWTSKDNGANWRDSAARFPAEAYDRMWQLATWGVGADGWLYVYTGVPPREPDDLAPGQAQAHHQPRCLPAVGPTTAAGGAEVPSRPP